MPLLSVYSTLPLTQAAVADGLGRIYALGGFARVEDVLVPIDSVVSVDTETGQWREDTAMPTPRALSGGVLYGGRIYVMGGRSKEPFLVRAISVARWMHLLSLVTSLLSMTSRLRSLGVHAAVALHSRIRSSLWLRLWSRWMY